MKKVSSHILKVLAALVWYIGGVVLLLKGGSLLLEADRLRPDQEWPWLALVFGLSLGGLKARGLFGRSCKNNLERIEALESPKLWQFFRPGFFVFLVIMILAGASLSRLAQGSYPFLITVGLLELSIATALLGSSYIFWTHKAVEK
jgi:MFS-type transporter involved in bile tolerance (Atg22 family)